MQVRLILTLQSEPLTGALYGFAINRVFGKDIYGSADPLGPTVRCRVEAILTAVEGDSSKCLEAGGGGECAD